jgi:superfamily I DNA/RNA helicase
VPTHNPSAYESPQNELLMLSIESYVGRLLESRLITPFSDLELDQYDAQRAKLAKRLLAIYPRFVNCADLRQVRVLTSNQTRRFIEMFRINNPMLERAAFLISKQTLSIQVRRVIMESNNPNRRYFEDIEELYSWLDEVLVPEERARLREFFNEV